MPYYTININSINNYNIYLVRDNENVNRRSFVGEEREADGDSHKIQQRQPVTKNVDEASSNSFLQQGYAAGRLQSAVHFAGCP